MKDPKLYLIHIKESLQAIERYAGNMSAAQLIADDKTYNAVLRVLQTMSESTKRLPDAIKAKYPDIQWQDIAGFRNVLVHDYLGDYDAHIIWNVIKDKLPGLKAVVEEELG
jgi:uncharacterized protein with HEPN domain